MKKQNYLFIDKIIYLDGIVIRINHKFKMLLDTKISKLINNCPFKYHQQIGNESPKNFQEHQTI